MWIRASNKVITTFCELQEVGSSLRRERNDEDKEMITNQISKHLPRAGKSKRKESKGYVRRKEAAKGTVKSRVSGSLRQKRSEYMTQSNAFFHKSLMYLWSPREAMIVEAPHNKKISCGSADGEKKSTLPSAK